MLKKVSTYCREVESCSLGALLGLLVIAVVMTVLTTFKAYGGEPDLIAASINTEWLWTPKDGRADGERVSIRDMRLKDYEAELGVYAKLVRENGINLLAVQEIENKSVAEDLARKLGPQWRAYFKQGRDTATGQDVALLSSLKHVRASTTDFGFPKGKIANERKGKGPSKLVGARFEHPKTGKRFWAITTHLLSRKNNSKRKDRQRLQQAQALVNAVKTLPKNEEVLLLADFNVPSGSPELTLIQRQVRMKNSAQHCRQKLGIKRRQRALIDHILSRGFACHTFEVKSLGKVSDHPAVIARLQ